MDGRTADSLHAKPCGTAAGKADLLSALPGRNPLILLPHKWRKIVAALLEDVACD